MRSLLALLLLSPFAAAAQTPAAPKSVSDCEGIRGDLAYNQCLAAFGPKLGDRAARGPELDDDEAVSRARRGGGSVRRSRGGRETATFDIVSGRRRGTAATPRQAHGPQGRP